MPQITVTDVPQLIPTATLASGTTVPGLTLQLLGAEPIEYAPRSNLSYGGANGGLRLAPGSPGGNATPVRVGNGIYVVTAAGKTSLLAYEFC